MPIENRELESAVRKANDGRAGSLIWLLRLIVRA